MTITSFANPKIKHIRKLAQKKYRKETGAFFVEGLRTVGEALQTGAAIEALVIAPGLLVSEFGQSLFIQAQEQDIASIEVSDAIFSSFTPKRAAQGIGAVVLQKWQNLDDITVSQQDMWIALDAVADPGNLGTIIRTADAVGCQGVILLGNATDPHDPTAVKASMGALFSQDLIRTDWSSFLRWRNKYRLTLAGTSDSAELDYQAVKYKHPLVLLMGSERHGLNKEMMAACDHMVRIPMAGRSDSLNLAAASAVMLYEIYNQSRNREVTTP